MALSELADGIRALLGAAEVDPPKRLSGGASRETYIADYRDAQGNNGSVVLRRDPPGHGDAARMRAEAACLRAAAAADVPVPVVLAAGDDAPGIDAPYLLTNKVSGDATPRVLQRDPALATVRPGLAAEFGRILARIHSAPLDAVPMLDAQDPLDTIEAVYRATRRSSPAVEIGLRWLRATPTPDRPEALVHGDFRVGNVMVDADGVQAVLDWELAHRGNPIEDLGWLCVRAWRFGSPDPVGGIGTRADLLAGYAEVAGTAPDAAELHWWEVFGTLKWLVLSIFQSLRHFSGGERSIELAAIGRRVCESEYDLLCLLGLFQVAEPAVPVDHGRPTLADILELVSGVLAETGAHAPGHLRHEARVASYLLQVAAREVALQPAGDSEDALAQRIQADDERWQDPDVQRTVSAAVLARLRVSNPRHLLPDH